MVAGPPAGLPPLLTHLVTVGTGQLCFLPRGVPQRRPAAGLGPPAVGAPRVGTMEEEKPQYRPPPLIHLPEVQSYALIRLKTRGSLHCGAEPVDLSVSTNPRPCLSAATHNPVCLH
ncbi:unnamed protein product [Arctogadus glacialis]